MVWKLGACEKTERMLWDYASRRLPASDRADVDSHLLGCDRCRLALEKTTSTVALMSAFREEPLPAPISSWQNLEIRLAARRQAKPTAGTWYTRRTSVGFAGACLAAALGIGFFGLPGLHITTPSNRTAIVGRSKLVTRNSEADSALSVASGTALTSHAGVTGTAGDVNRHLGTDVQAGTGIAVPQSTGSAGSYKVTQNGADQVSVMGTSRLAGNHVVPGRRMRRTSNVAPEFAYNSRNHRSYSGSNTATNGTDTQSSSASTTSDFVLSTVAENTDQDTSRRYVMGTISDSTRLASASYEEGTEEGRAW